MIEIVKKKLDPIFFYFLLLFSFLTVAFYDGYLGYLTALLGYGLLFYLLFKCKTKKERFALAFFFFFFSELIHLSWMTSTTYVSLSFLVVYFFMAAALGVEFAVLALFVEKKQKISQILALCAFWTILEWSRLFFICGFSFSPIGLCYANNHFSMQLASIFGIYGLSFWVMLVNLFGLRAFYNKKLSSFVFWILLFAFPYFFGFINEKIQSRYFIEKQNLSVLLVQTALAPEQKDPWVDKNESFISPFIQWKRILTLLKEHEGKKIDLIVLPEAALPFGAYKNIYPFECFLSIWERIFGEQSLNFLPPLIEPIAHKSKEKRENDYKISNSYWSKAIANYFDADLVIGLDDRDFFLNESYNSAFYFSSKKEIAERYEKQILVPIVEYFPISLCQKIAKKYGIDDCFTKGKKNKVFYGKVPFAVSICYEETFGDLIRKSCKNGAKLLVNISNDGYFPSSKLPKKHFEHGKFRSVENGVPIIRACNTGITGVVDCFGRVLKTLDEKDAGVAYVEVPIFSYDTIYTTCGDKLILGICFFLLINGLYFERKKILKRFKISR
jgi:apolipoprotein N-acyltransferase